MEIGLKNIFLREVLHGWTFFCLLLPFLAYGKVYAILSAG